MPALSVEQLQHMRDQVFFEGPDKRRRLSRFWLLLTPNPPKNKGFRVSLGLSIREKRLPTRENGGRPTNPAPDRKAPFRCAHLLTHSTGFR